ncbi:hypothetical protein GGQ65_000277 [Rhizobium fabae]|uniref:Uncharacterized protein n=1 Tax=Rhizobium fabae TaxID=573179 RepID=A0A7W6B6K0_9HYPH|nr:hypothetical protein [Rhizobium fabae]
MQTPPAAYHVPRFGTTISGIIAAVSGQGGGVGVSNL